MEFWLNGAKVTEFNLDSDKFKEAVAKSQRVKDKPYFGKTTEACMPCLTSAAGSAPNTSASPPVFANGAASDATIITFAIAHSS